jgi:hypothetical protein
MTKQFLKANEVSLQNGGYLTGKNDIPVSNVGFVQAQERAHYVITFAKLAKGKNFKSVQADSLEDLKREVMDSINSNKAIEFVTKPELITRTVTDTLAQEAMSFMNYQKDLSKVEQVNAYLQQFKILQEFEEYGLFFDQEIVKLSNIYTLKEIIEAVNQTIDLI